MHPVTKYITSYPKSLAIRPSGNARKLIPILYEALNAPIALPLSSDFALSITRALSVGYKNPYPMLNKSEIKIALKALSTKYIAASETETIKRHGEAMTFLPRLSEIRPPNILTAVTAIV